MLHEELTGKILKACFEVSKEMGVGFIESVYEKSLFVALQQMGLKAELQVPLKVKFRKVIVGDFFADIVVEDKIIVELKAVSGLVKEHYAQLLNYLRTTGIEVGLIVNFGVPKLEYRRFDNKFIQNSNDRDSLGFLLNE